MRTSRTVQLAALAATFGLALAACSAPDTDDGGGSDTDGNGVRNFPDGGADVEKIISFLKKRKKLINRFVTLHICWLSCCVNGHWTLDIGYLFAFI